MDGVHCVTRIEKISHTLRSQESMAFNPTLAQTIQVAPAPCEVRVGVAQTWNQDSSVPFKTPFLWILQQKMFSHDHSNLCETFTWEWIRAGGNQHISRLWCLPGSIYNSTSRIKKLNSGRAPVIEYGLVCRW